MTTALARQAENQDRQDVLVAMSLAYNQHRLITDEAEEISNVVLEALSALPNEDLAAVREKLAYYNDLTPMERQSWRSRVFSRINNRNLQLDKNVHATQIAAVLSKEPQYIADFILFHLSPEMSSEVASIWRRETQTTLQSVSVTSGLENLIRQQFLRNFVVREDLPELKPLSLLDSEELLALVQKLGQHEIAFVCRGVREVESLAPFLRRFNPIDSQAILEQMANLKTVEKRRLDMAEVLVKDAWTIEKDPALIIQLIGLYKLASALHQADDLTIRYTTQKLPMSLAEKVHSRIELSGDDSAVDEIYQSETETLAAQIWLEKMPATEE